MSKKTKSSFKLGYIILTIGLLFYVAGFFDLHQTKFGYTSDLLDQGMTFIILGWIALKVEE